jgi:hypothetical protein
MRKDREENRLQTDVPRSDRIPVQVNAGLELYPVHFELALGHCLAITAIVGPPT